MNTPLARNVKCRELRLHGATCLDSDILSVSAYPLPQHESQLQNSKKGVTPAKAGVQKFLKRMDSRFRGNDNPGILQ
jgi:hypothetical protein